MQYETILNRREGGVVTITLNRPHSLNGIDARMRAELAHALRAACGKGGARAVVLTGAGRGFCSGQDLGDSMSPADADPERVLRDEYGPILAALAESEAPVICAVNGPAAGAGANLALACDVVVAARSAYFLQAFARIGLMPDVGGTYHLPRLVGLPRAMGMCLFAEPIPASQAAEWGLIWEVVEDHALAGRAAELAARLADGPTRAYRAIRQSLRRSLASGYEEQLLTEAKMQGELGRSRDFAEGVASFLEKRAPRFEGR